MDATASSVDRIIDRFGGLSAMARALGHRNPTTVQGWRARGVIPARQQPRVLEAAKQLKIPMAPSDFFDADPAVAPASAEAPR